MHNLSEILSPGFEGRRTEMRTEMTEGILLLLLAAGIAAAALPELEDLIRILLHRTRTWIRRFQNEEDWLSVRREQYVEKVPEHIRKLLQMTFSMGTRQSVRAFFLVSAALAGVTVFFCSSMGIPVSCRSGRGLQRIDSLSGFALYCAGTTCRRVERRRGAGYGDIELL